jgi:hypothetical protein
MLRCPLSSHIFITPRDTLKFLGHTISHLGLERLHVKRRSKQETIIQFSVQSVPHSLYKLAYRVMLLTTLLGVIRTCVPLLCPRTGNVERTNMQLTPVHNLTARRLPSLTVGS